VDDEERVRRLLRGTARLEFRLMAEPAELQRSLQQIVEHYQTADTGAAAADTAAQDLAAADTAGAAVPGDTAFNVGDIVSGGVEQQEGTGNSLLDVFQPMGQGVQFGLVAEQDTATVNRLLSVPEVEDMLPSGVTLMYTSSPVATTEDGSELYAVLGVREEVELTGDVITDARVDFSQTNQPEVSMTMNSEGASDWARITGANVNRPIAIVLDDIVYSYPTVINRIPNGRSSITGLESQEEAQDIVTILKSGALPAPLEIVEERVVGPSLGEAAVRAGVICLIVGLLAVATLMAVYYKGAGMVANLALLTTIFLILGVLAAFNATLTLPGIAGIVLTMGMAVDANVLIYERVREELATGKSLKAAIDAGFSKAFSAIFDGNITTFFVGVILYSFGVGPIQGFAVTLMAGILVSMFCALILSRLVFDYMVSERRMAVSFG
jgi:preprotein translocase subunit SecD